MPELPDITVYIEALADRIISRRLVQVRLKSPFLLRTFDPPIENCAGKHVVEIRRIGKRIAIGLEDELWMVFYLMIAGRLHWKSAGAKLATKTDLVAFDFEHGSLTLTEAGAKKRASLHLVQGDDALAKLDPGGIDVLGCDLEAFRAALAKRNHTLKRALTEPTLFSGIGNAYSDEILHRARLSPVQWTERLSMDEIERLYDAVQVTLMEWTERLRQETGGGFPEGVTAFRPEMAVHGKFGQPCPVCRTKVQRIQYADRETNYCPRCQTGGKLLADRSLSRLLKDDWPKSIDDLEA